LDVALDYGIKEWEFWDMTIAELIRLIESKKRIQKLDLQQQAIFDLTLADAIGRSVARIYSSSAEMPQIYDLYPSLFDAQEIEEKQQEAKDKASAARFIQYAQFHNKKFKEGAIKE